MFVTKDKQNVERTQCQMLSLNEIQCETPLGYDPQTTVDVSMVADKHLILTKFNYTFLDGQEFRHNKVPLNYSAKTTKFFKKVYSIFTNTFNKIKNNLF